MFSCNNPNPYQSYSQPAQFPQRPMYQQPAYQQPMMQDGAIQARFVTGEAEALASTVIPGSMVLFYDRAQGRIYSKLIDPQTGMPEVRMYTEVRQQPEPEQPRWATQDDIAKLRQEFEELKGAIGDV